MSYKQQCTVTVEIPSTHEWTGEFRAPLRNEEYLVWQGEISKATFDYKNLSFILRAKPTPLSLARAHKKRLTHGGK